MNNYFGQHISQLLQQKCSDGSRAIEFAIKYKSTLSKILINENLVDVRNFSADSSILKQLIESNNKELIESCLEKGLDINKRDSSGLTLLMIAAKSAALDIVELLVQKGADIDKIGPGYNKALHIAAMNGNTEVALYLIGFTQDLSHKNRDGDDILMLAAKNNLPSLVSYLNVEIVLKQSFNNEGYNALHLTAIYGYTDIISKLLEMGFDVNQGSQQVEETQLYNVTPLKLSMSNGKQETAIFLIKNVALLTKEDSVGNNAFVYGVHSKHEHMLYFIKTLNDFYDESNQRKMMVAAARSDNVNMLRELYLKCVSLNFLINKSGDSLLHIASQANSKNVFNFLLEQGAGVNLFDTDGNTALHLAAMQGYSAITLQLIKSGASINLKDASGKTALLIASELGHYSCVLQLLKANANFAVKDSNAVTPSQMALINHHFDIVKLLFAVGDTSLTRFTKDGIPAYVLQEMEKNKDLIDLLKIFEQNLEYTASNSLILAVKMGNIDAIKLLVNKNPKYINQADRLGKIPEDYASKEIQYLLMNYKANSDLSVNSSISQVTPKKINSADLVTRLKFIINEMIPGLNDKWPIQSLLNLLKKLPIASITQFIHGLSETKIDSREVYAKYYLNLLSTIDGNKEWLNSTNEAFLRPYKWNILVDFELLNVIHSVQKINNSNLIQWFFSFFKPLEINDIQQNQLEDAIKLFNVFISHFNPNLSNIPRSNLSF